MKWYQKKRPPKKLCAVMVAAACSAQVMAAGLPSMGEESSPRITSYNVCYTKLLRVGWHGYNA